MLEKLALVSKPPKLQEIENIAPQHVLVMRASTGDIAADSTTEFRLGDYVVVIRSGVAIPPGSHGQ